MNGDAQLSKRYAAAFLNLFDAQFNAAIIERCLQASAFFADTPAARLTLRLSTIRGAVQRECLVALIKRYDLPDSLLQLVDLLSEHNRLPLLPGILDQIALLFKERHSIAEYQVISPYKLQSDQLTDIVRFLEKMTGKKIIITEKIDQSLIAGIRLLGDTTLWEYSIQKQLSQLQHQFNA